MKVLSKPEPLALVQADFREVWNADINDLSWVEIYNGITRFSEDGGTHFGAYWNGFSSRYPQSDSILITVAMAVISSNSKKKPKPLPTPADGSKPRMRVRRNYVLDRRDKEGRKEARNKQADAILSLRKRQAEYTEKLRKKKSKVG